MEWYPNTYALILFACAFATISVATYAWHQRTLVGASPAVALLGIVIWSLGYAVATGFHDLTNRILCAKVQYIGIALAAVAMATFAIRYSGHVKWLTRRNILLLAVVPGVGTLLAWTNEAHHLIWASTQLRIRDSIALLDISYGPYFWFYAGYNYLILLTSAGLFLRVARRSAYLQRQQALIMLIGVLFPTVFILLYLMRLSPFPDLDLAPLGWSACGLIIAWGLFRHHLFNLVPIARDTLIENMADGVLVLDAQNRIVDINLAAQQIGGITAPQAIGTRADVLLGTSPGLIEQLANSTDAQTELALGADPARCFDLRISPLFDSHKNLTGRLIVLHDITDRKQTESELHRANEHLQTQLREIENLQAELREQAIRDPLTGSFNRRYMEETLEREIACARRDQCPLSIVMMDIDHFKIVNDTCGHRAGDLFLQRVASLLHTQTRQMDVVCRYGGEEFVVIMPGARAEMAFRRADEWRRAVEMLTMNQTGETLHVTLSLGVATFPEHGQTSDALLGAADAALYAAKNAGRNCAMIWNGESK